jgi:hypothetical protein
MISTDVTVAPVTIRIIAYTPDTYLKARANEFQVSGHRNRPSSSVAVGDILLGYVVGVGFVTAQIVIDQYYTDFNDEVFGSASYPHRVPTRLMIDLGLDNAVPLVDTDIQPGGGNLKDCAGGPQDTRQDVLRSMLSRSICNF